MTCMKQNKRLPSVLLCQFPLWLLESEMLFLKTWRFLMVIISRSLKEILFNLWSLISFEQIQWNLRKRFYMRYQNSSCSICPWQKRALRNRLRSITTIWSLWRVLIKDQCQAFSFRMLSYRCRINLWWPNLGLIQSKWINLCNNRWTKISW